MCPSPDIIPRVATHLFSWYRKITREFSWINAFTWVTVWMNGTYIHYNSYTSNSSIAPTHFSLWVILSSGEHQTVSHNVIQFEVQIDTEPGITVYTKVKWPSDLSLRRTYVTYSRATLGRPVTWIPEVQAKVGNLSWRLPTTAWIRRTWVCILWTWIKHPTSCSRNNLCVSYPHVLWMMMVAFKIVRSGRRMKRF